MVPRRSGDGGRWRRNSRRRAPDPGNRSDRVEPVVDLRSRRRACDEVRKARAGVFGVETGGSVATMRATYGWSELSSDDKRDIIDAIVSGRATRAPRHVELDLTDRCNVACY